MNIFVSEGWPWNRGPRIQPSLECRFAPEAAEPVCSKKVTGRPKATAYQPLILGSEAAKLQTPNRKVRAARLHFERPSVVAASSGDGDE